MLGRMKASKGGRRRLDKANFKVAPGPELDPGVDHLGAAVAVAPPRTRGGPTVTGSHGADHGRHDHVGGDSDRDPHLQAPRPPGGFAPAEVRGRGVAGAPVPVVVTVAAGPARAPGPLSRVAFDLATHHDGEEGPTGALRLPSQEPAPQPPQEPQAAAADPELGPPPGACTVSAPSTFGTIPSEAMVAAAQLVGQPEWQFRPRTTPAAASRHTAGGGFGSGEEADEYPSGSVDSPQAQPATAASSATSPGTPPGGWRGGVLRALAGVGRCVCSS
jgi:hypothetical protein